jgi:hypothetical protein
MKVVKTIPKEKEEREAEGTWNPIPHRAHSAVFPLVEL